MKDCIIGYCDLIHRCFVRGGCFSVMIRIQDYIFPFSFNLSSNLRGRATGVIIWGLGCCYGIGGLVNAKFIVGSRSEGRLTGVIVLWGFCLGYFCLIVIFYRM